MKYCILPVFRPCFTVIKIGTYWIYSKKWAWSFLVESRKKPAKYVNHSDSHDHVFPDAFGLVFWH